MEDVEKLNIELFQHGSNPLSLLQCLVEAPQSGQAIRIQMKQHVGWTTTARVRHLDSTGYPLFCIKREKCNEQL